MYDIYICRAGETYDSIALAEYGDEKYAYEILAVNPELCRIVVFSGGERLKMPILYIPADAEEEYALAIAPWKE